MDCQQDVTSIADMAKGKQMTEYIVSEEDFDMIPDVGPDWVRRRSNTLVRCKDCKWHLPKYPGERPTCLIYAGDWHDYDYCSRAERKEK